MYNLKIETDLVYTWVKKVDTGFVCTRFKKVEFGLVCTTFKKVDTGLVCTWVKNLDIGLVCTRFKKVHTGLVCTWGKEVDRGMVNTRPLWGGLPLCMSVHWVYSRLFLKDLQPRRTTLNSNWCYEAYWTLVGSFTATYLVAAVRSLPCC